MTLSNSPSTQAATPGRSRRPWYRPMVSPDHGMYVVLLVSFLIGAAAAHRWTLETTLALICAMAGLQAEHPLSLQIKQRHSWKPRLLLWAGLYGGLALGLAIRLYWQSGPLRSPLLAIYIGAGLALGLNGLAVLYRQQRSVLNELLTFAAVCLATPFAYIATLNQITPLALGLWALCTLALASTIFTVKLRKLKSAESLQMGLIRAGAYHGIAPLLVIGLYYTGLIPLWPALAFTMVLIKFVAVLLSLPWYQQAAIGPVATLETASALVFAVIASAGLLVGG